MSKTLQQVNPTVPRTMLMGAGFSKIFGGYLAYQINDDLLSDLEIRRRPELLNLVRTKSNYEDVLAEVFDQSYSDEARICLENAVQRIYSNQNRSVTNFGYDSPNIVRFKTLLPFKTFLKLVVSGSVSAPPNLSSFLFTLNQDLFFESMIGADWDWNGPQMRLPGLATSSWGVSQETMARDLNNRVEIQESEKMAEGLDFSTAVNLIKLHGSSNWFSSESRILVMGSNKSGQIKRNGLLQAYKRAFGDVCQIEGMKMLIIGYGFGDEHINEQLASGVENGLQLWIWDCIDRRTWSERILGSRGYPAVKFGEKIVEGVAGYLSEDFGRIFYGNHGNPPDHLTLRRFLDLE